MEGLSSVLTLSQAVAGRNQYEPCSNDGDCSEGHFCRKYNKNKSSCIPCINCDRYFRLAGDTRCSKDPQDCGQCILGYEIQLFSDNTEKASCVPSATTSLPPPDKVEHWWKENLFIIPSGVLLLALLVGIVVWIVKKYKLSFLSVPERLSVNFCAQGPSLNNQRNSKIPEVFTQDQNPALRSPNEATAPLLPSQPSEPIQQFAPTAPLIPRTEEDPNYPVVGCKENDNIQRSAVWRNARYANNGSSTEQSGTSEGTVSSSGAQPANPNGASQRAETTDTSHPIHLIDAPNPQQSYDEPHCHYNNQGASSLSPGSHVTRFPERRYACGQDAVHIPLSSNLWVPTEPPPYSDVYPQDDPINPTIDDLPLGYDADYPESNTATQGSSNRPDSPTSSFAHESERPDREDDNRRGSSHTERLPVYSFTKCQVVIGSNSKSVYSSVETDSLHHVSTGANIR